MGKRKVAQRNTLARWAGIDPNLPPRSTILIFKVDAQRLRNVCKVPRPTSEPSFSTSSTDEDVASRVSDSIKSDHSTQVSNGTTTNRAPSVPIVPHPFFCKLKKQAVLEPSSGIVSKPGPLEVKPQVPHAFFRPRERGSTTTSSSEGQAEQTRVSQQAIAALLPSRTTMHVVPVPTNRDDTKAQTRPISLGQRQRSRLITSSSDQSWQQDDWWQSYSRRKIEPAVPAKVNRESLLTNSIYTTDRKSKTKCAAMLRLEDPGVKARLDSACEQGSLWTTRYAPHKVCEVLTSGSEVQLLFNWLKSRNLRMKDRLQFAAKRSGSSLQQYPNECDDFIVDDDLSHPPTSDIGAPFDDDEGTTLCPSGRELLWRSNIIILCGPIGCGKSAAVQAVAEELQYEIFEVNALDRRSSKDVLERVGEASQSQMVNKQKAADGSQSKSLLLFEEVDVLFRDDKDFWTSVLSLASTSKRPVILTCNDDTVLPAQLETPSLRLEFKQVRADLATEYLQLVCAAEGCSVDEQIVNHLLEKCHGDLRATINSLQFLAIAGNSPTIVNGDLLHHELMSRQMQITDLFDSRTREIRKCTKAVYHEYEQAMETMSLIDNFSSQQQSLALEEREVFENETEELQARGIEKDDLVGAQIISEPQGRYTRLHPGDANLVVDIALSLESVLSAKVKDNYPIYAIQPRFLDTKSPHDLTKRRENDMWNKMIESCDPFAVPENWMQDYAPHNSIDRARLSGILAAQLLPYLREMSTAEDEREAMEKRALENHVGRTTRNTMSNEFGIPWRRPVKIPAATREEILTTALNATDAF